MERKSPIDDPNIPLIVNHIAQAEIALSQNNPESAMSHVEMGLAFYDRDTTLKAHAPNQYIILKVMRSRASYMTLISSPEGFDPENPEFIAMLEDWKVALDTPEEFQKYFSREDIIVLNQFIQIIPKLISTILNSLENSEDFDTVLYEELANIAVDAWLVISILSQESINTPDSQSIHFKVQQIACHREIAKVLTSLVEIDPNTDWGVEIQETRLENILLAHNLLEEVETSSSEIEGYDQLLSELRCEIPLLLGYFYVLTRFAYSETNASGDSTERFLEEIYEEIISAVKILYGDIEIYRSLSADEKLICEFVMGCLYYFKDRSDILVNDHFEAVCEMYDNHFFYANPPEHIDNAWDFAFRHLGTTNSEA